MGRNGAIKRSSSRAEKQDSRHLQNFFRRSWRQNDEYLGTKMTISTHQAADERIAPISEELEF